jgi:hypothetical protein
VTGDGTSCREWLESQGFHAEDVTGAGLEEKADPPSMPDYRLMPLPSMIVVHHSATPSGSARLFRCLHRAVNGWEDIGYHYVIGNGTHSGDGEVEPGRPEGVRGAHARGSNHCSIGICLVGDFESGDPTDTQLASLGALLAELMDRLCIPQSGVVLHRDVKGCSTVCPGRNLPLGRVLGSLPG